MDERERHQRNAYSNYVPVLNIGKDLNERLPFNKDELFPQDWRKDPLLLLGQYLAILELSEHERQYFTESTWSLIERHGPEWVWNSRLRMAAEIEFIRTFFDFERDVFLRKTA